MRAPGNRLSARARSPISAPPRADASPTDVASLYRAHAARVGRWAARLGGPSIEVEDVVQEVFLVAKRRLVSFNAEGGGAVTTWLFRCTDRIVKAARRKQRLRRLLGLAPADAADAGADIAGPIPSDELERRQEIAHVYRVLDRLPERQRKVLILFELEGLSTNDIAALIGARVGTIRVWLYRARAAFLQQHELLTTRDRRSEDDRP
jgi:RNA polymerase sigma-70 factor (ECF subfamily)